MPLLSRSQQVAIKVEGTEGTAETLAAANAGFNIFDASFSPDIAGFERNPNRATIGRLATLPGVKLGRVTMQTELVGSGDPDAPTPPVDAILQSCGYQKAASVEKLNISTPSGKFLVGETVTGGTSGATGTVVRPNTDNDAFVYITAKSGTFQSEGITGQTSGVTGLASGASVAENSVIYRPNSGSNQSYTVGVYQDGLRHIIKGARGNVNFSAAVGEPMQMQVEYIGALESTADAAALTGIAYPSSVPPQLLGVNLRLGTYAPVFENISINTGNDLQPRRNANDSSGVISTLITARAIGGNLDPEATIISGGEDFFSKLSTAAQFELQMNLGSADGNSFNILGPSVQYSNISGGERNGIITNQVDLNFNESGTDGDLIILCNGSNV